MIYTIPKLVQIFKKRNKMKKLPLKKVNKFYEFGTYKPSWNSVPVRYKGTDYLSKAQCIALEGITRKELEEYLQKVKGLENVMKDVIAKNNGKIPADL